MSLKLAARSAHNGKMLIETGPRRTSCPPTRGRKFARIHGRPRQSTDATGSPQAADRLLG
jgi:hypothetical protein